MSLRHALKLNECYAEKLTIRNKTLFLKKNNLDSACSQVNIFHCKGNDIRIKTSIPGTSPNYLHTEKEITQLEDTKSLRNGVPLQNDMLQLLQSEIINNSTIMAIE